jgi:N-hydroxyarylamine O-acetyltransferase
MYDAPARYMDAGSYLARISYTGSIQPGAETLRALHRAHLLAVPFENLSIHAGVPIVLNEAALFDKVVRRRLGGFCYELNGLFAWLLRQLGFEVQLLSAGVMGAGGEFGPPFDHMALAVTLEEPWLADVGFGDCFIDPLRLDSPTAQAQANGTYHLVSGDDGSRVLFRARRGEEPRPQYRVFPGTWSLADYNEMCSFHQTSPLSPFTQKRVCSLLTSTGRITLSGMQLIETDERGTRREHALEDQAAVDQTLKQTFGISSRPDH